MARWLGFRPSTLKSHCDAEDDVGGRELQRRVQSRAGDEPEAIVGDAPRFRTIV